MSAELKPDLPLEIAYLLLMDVVGYSKLLVNEQIELLQELNRIVRDTETFHAAEKEGKLIRLPTGDGMALLFFRSPEQPVQCALEIAQSLKSSPNIKLRMGIHSGPVNQVTDVNDQSNVAGAGINVAQRVMDCGDAGHVLLSKHVADDLAQYGHWRPYLYDLGEFQVKHGLRLHIVNLHKDGLGNPAAPQKLDGRHRWGKRSKENILPVRPPRWPQIVLLATIILLGLALISTLFLRLVPEKSIAVLPFADLSEGEQNIDLAAGLQDEILTDLARVANLKKVISRTSVMQYKAPAQRNVRDIARDLGVAHILEGTVQRIGDQIRVTVQLIDAKTDAHIWAERYDRRLIDVFTLESELAETIVAQLKAKLSPEEKAAIEKPPTTDLGAYGLYQRAKTLIERAVSNTGREDLSEAVRLLDQALVRDPSFAPAYYQLAHAHDQIYLRGFDHTPARLALAQHAVEMVRRLSPDSGEAHLAQAKHLYWGYLDYDRARQELIAARRALPNDPLPFLLIGYIDRRQGRWQESTENIEHALKLDPRNPQSVFILQQLSVTHACLRDYSQAIVTLRRALAIAPRDSTIRVQLARDYLDWKAETAPLRSTLAEVISENPESAPSFASESFFVALCERDAAAAAKALSVMPPDGCHEEAIPFPRGWCEGRLTQLQQDPAAAQRYFAAGLGEVQKIVRDQPDDGPAFCALAVLDAALGKKEEAIREGRRAVELLPVERDSINGALIMQYLALIYTWTGDKDQALEELAATAKVPGFLSYGELKLDPAWDPLRDDPRFDRIVMQMPRR